MRKAEGKQYGYIVLPVVVPTGSGLTDSEVLEGSDFKHVWAVLRALRSHDERMDVWVNAADLGGKPMGWPAFRAALCGRLALLTARGGRLTPTGSER